VIVNTFFAVGYYAIGAPELQGSDSMTSLGRFLNDFFFSAQTLSTVGYGAMSPRGLAANVLSSLESMVGLMGFALATGLLFGRVSRPSARIAFSERMAIAPYQDGWSLQFRIVNKRSNSLMELEAKMLLMTVDGPKREYMILKLERPSVYFFPLTWTIVHPIDAESPLAGMTAADLAAKQAEFVILLKAFDDTFSQTVFSRYSYRHDEVQWGKRFAPAFAVTEQGDMTIELDKIGAVTDAGR